MIAINDNSYGLPRDFPGEFDSSNESRDFPGKFNSNRLTLLLLLLLLLLLIVMMVLLLLLLQGIFPESLTQAMLVGTMIVGREGNLLPALV